MAQFVSLVGFFCFNYDSGPIVIKLTQSSDCRGKRQEERAMLRRRDDVACVQWLEWSRVLERGERVNVNVTNLAALLIGEDDANCTK